MPTAYVAQVVETAFPEYEHSIYWPSATCIPTIKASDFDHVVGYSLGSLLVLNSIEQFRGQTHITLLAPIFAFRQEAHMGSRVTTTQLKYMQRWLKREPLAAIHDFYRRAKLGIAPTYELPYPIDDLAWGLGILLNMQVSLAATQGCTCVIGKDDPLLDSDYYNNVQSQLPDTRVRIEACNHDIKTMAPWALGQ